MPKAPKAKSDAREANGVTVGYEAQLRRASEA